MTVHGPKETLGTYLSQVAVCTVEKRHLQDKKHGDQAETGPDLALGHQGSASQEMAWSDTVYVLLGFAPVFSDDSMTPRSPKGHAHCSHVWDLISSFQELGDSRA